MGTVKVETTAKFAQVAKAAVRELEASTEIAAGSIPDLPFDREQAFILFATFCGDLEKTAHALNVEPVVLLRVVDEEHWTEKLGPILTLKKSARPGDLEKGINRALNFVQAHRMRLLLEKLLQRLSGLNAAQLEEYCVTRTANKDGTIRETLSTRPLADLATAIEKCHQMTYAALSDTATERVRRAEEPDPQVAGSEMHAKIASAMADIRSSKSARAQLFDAQLAQAQVVTPKPAKA